MIYSRYHIVFHWITALLILVMLATGLAYSYELGGKGAMTTHQWAGQILIIVLLLRLGGRIVNRPRPAQDGQTLHGPLERLLAHATHIALYLVMIAFVVTGYVSASAFTQSALLAPVDIVFARSPAGERFLDAHYMMKWVLLGLLALHFSGTLKHLIWDRDNTLSRMLSSSPKP